MFPTEDGMSFEKAKEVLGLMSEREFKFGAEDVMRLSIPANCFKDAGGETRLADAFSHINLPESDFTVKDGECALDMYLNDEGRERVQLFRADAVEQMLLDRQFRLLTWRELYDVIRVGTRLTTTDGECSFVPIRKAWARLDEGYFDQKSQALYSVMPAAVPSINNQLLPGYAQPKAGNGKRNQYIFSEYAQGTKCFVSGDNSGELKAWTLRNVTARFSTKYNGYVLYKPVAFEWSDLPEILRENYAEREGWAWILQDVVSANEFGTILCVKI